MDEIDRTFLKLRQVPLLTMIDYYLEQGIDITEPQLESVFERYGWTSDEFMKVLKENLNMPDHNE